MFPPFVSLQNGTQGWLRWRSCRRENTLPAMVLSEQYRVRCVWGLSACPIAGGRGWNFPLTIDAGLEYSYHVSLNLRLVDGRDRSVSESR